MSEEAKNKPRECFLLCTIGWLNSTMIASEREMMLNEAKQSKVMLERRKIVEWCQE